MLRKILLGAAASAALLPQASYAASASANVADPMRWAAAANATDPAKRCADINGSQYWFLEYPPNCVPPIDRMQR
jgi:hypothetical protein